MVLCSDAHSGTLCMGSGFMTGVGPPRETVPLIAALALSCGNATALVAAGRLCGLSAESPPSELRPDCAELPLPHPLKTLSATTDINATTLSKLGLNGTCKHPFN